MSVEVFGATVLLDKMLIGTLIDYSVVVFWIRNRAVFNILESICPPQQAPVSQYGAVGCRSPWR